MRQLGLVGLKTPIVVEAAVGKDGTVSVPRVDMAVDCGFAAYPEPSDTRVYIVGGPEPPGGVGEPGVDRKSTRLNSSHGYISYAVFCLKKKKKHALRTTLDV